MVKRGKKSGSDGAEGRLREGKGFRKCGGEGTEAGKGNRKLRRKGLKGEDGGNWAEKKGNCPFNLRRRKEFGEPEKSRQSCWRLSALIEKGIRPQERREEKTPGQKGGVLPIGEKWSL